MSNKDAFLPVLSQSCVVAIARNRATNWEDLSSKIRLFALEYSKAGNLAAAAKLVGVSPAKAQEAIDHPVVAAYIGDLVDEDGIKSSITRDFLEYHMLQTLEQVNGDIEVPVLTKDGEVQCKNFNAPSKIRLLKQMQDFLEVSRPAKAQTSLLSRVIPGQPRTFATPDDLWAACAEYFEWIEANPVYEIRVEYKAGKEQEIHTPKPRIPSEGTLVIFIGIRMDDWSGWAEDPAFAPVVEAAREIIREIKMSNAAVSTMNPNFIARDLGLADGYNVNNPDGNLRPPSIDFSKLSIETLRELRDAQSDDE